MKLADTQDGLKALIRWKSLLTSEDSLKLFAQVNEDFPSLLLHFFITRALRLNARRKPVLLLASREESLTRTS